MGERDGVRRAVGRGGEGEAVLGYGACERQQIARRRARQVGVDDEVDGGAESPPRCRAPPAPLLPDRAAGRPRVALRPAAPAPPRRRRARARPPARRRGRRPAWPRRAGYAPARRPGRAGASDRCRGRVRRRSASLGDTTEVAGPDNAAIAERLETLASLLDLAGSSHYSVRAYRRAAELIRATPAPVAQLVSSGRARELRGIGASIEARLRELVETGRPEGDRRAGERGAAGARRPRQAGRPRTQADGRARTGARRPHGRRAADRRRRGPAERGPGHRPADRGQDPSRRSTDRSRRPGAASS